MRVSLQWIKDFVDVKASPVEIADRLTMAGLEIEGIERVDGDMVIEVEGMGHSGHTGNDMVFEVNVTPNRPDCLSILGIAREVAAAFQLPLKMPAADPGEGLTPSGISVEIADTDLCSRYAGRQISGVTVSESPKWMRDRLEKCGIRPINNIVDVTNYVLLELGHPLHAFDADKLAERKIRVARAGRDAAIMTLDGVERKPDENSLLIWDGSGPVAIAGVMGGEGSAVTATTRNIFLESAYFEPTSVRRTSKQLGLRSESSYRFERGTDIEFLETALNRASLLMKETGGGTIHHLVDVYLNRYQPVTVEVSYERVNRLLGTAIPGQDILGILGRLGIGTEDKGETFLVTPPAYLRDIRHTVDVVEEVARIYGFGNIPSRVPKTALSDGSTNPRETAISSVRESVRKSGFTEAVNYSFMNTADLDMLSIPADDERRKYISVKNPLRQEDGAMRTTLAPALIRNFMHNISRGVRDIRFFELSKVFIDEGGRLPSERLRLGGLFYRDRSPSIWRQDLPSFYFVKGALEALLDELRLKESSYVMSEETFLHPGKAADVLIRGARAGYVGELGPAIIEKLDLKISKPEVVVFELDLDMVLGMVSRAKTYSQIPRYPSVERDMAIILDDDITADDVLRYFSGYTSDLIESIELFDYYKGKNMPEGKKSLAFRVVYRAGDRTLTDEESFLPKHVPMLSKRAISLTSTCLCFIASEVAINDILGPSTLTTVLPVFPSRSSRTPAAPALYPKFTSKADDPPERTRCPGVTSLTSGMMYIPGTCIPVFFMNSTTSGSVLSLFSSCCLTYFPAPASFLWPKASTPADSSYSISPPASLSPSATMIIYVPAFTSERITRAK
ncbi:MAG: phenylalanine--tRNA ligase subunit beta [Nitrospirae bacterium]|nr:phenylalanine--tRNA ligase subunit beta [Nitrospirota bacterium]